MRHKFIIRISENLAELIISELAEVDKGLFSPLCEEKFDMQALRTAASEGEVALVAALRSVNFYPPLEYANQIAQIVLQLRGADAPERRELLIDDRQVMAADEAALAAIAARGVLPAEVEVEDLDDLLEDDASADLTTLEDEEDGDKEDN